MGLAIPADDEELHLDEKMPALKRLAAVVKKGRAKKGWSQANLAQFIGTSRDVIKRIEAGEHDARASVVFRLLPVLEMDDQDLKRILFGQKGMKE